MPDACNKPSRSLIKNNLIILKTSANPAQALF